MSGLRDRKGLEGTDRLNGAGHSRFGTPAASQPPAALGRTATLLLIARQLSRFFNLLDNSDDLGGGEESGDGEARVPAKSDIGSGGRPQSVFLPTLRLPPPATCEIADSVASGFLVHGSAPTEIQQRLQHSRRLCRRHRRRESCNGDGCCDLSDTVENTA